MSKSYKPLDKRLFKQPKPMPIVPKEKMLKEMSEEYRRGKRNVSGFSDSEIEAGTGKKDRNFKKVGTIRQRIANNPKRPKLRMERTYSIPGERMSTVDESGVRYNQGGIVKKLKKINPKKNPGLAKLPKEVQAKMGYSNNGFKKGGAVVIKTNQKPYVG